MTPSFAQSLGGIAQQPRFFVWKCTWSPEKGKWLKAPCEHPSIPYPHDVSDPSYWLPYDAAVERVNAFRAFDPAGRYLLGWYMAEGCGYWFLDIDKCIGPDGAWHPVALQLWQALPGAFMEYSSSGTGVHLIGRGEPDTNRTRPPKEQADVRKLLELYSQKRGIAFGHDGVSWGDADTLSPGIAAVVAHYFPRNAAGGDGDEPGKWDNGPRADWLGPEDDGELLAKALRSSSIAAKHGSKASFQQLWTNSPELDRFYAGESEKDGALAQQLAFWTGCDAARMERLMRQSSMARGKWDEHRTYLRELTINGACDRQEAVYRQQDAAAALYASTITPLPTIAPPMGLTDLAPRVDLINPDQVRALDEALAMATSATSDIDMHNRVIPAIRLLGLPPALMVRVANTVNRTLSNWDAKLPLAQLRSLLGHMAPGDRPEADVLQAGRPAWVDNWAYLTSPDCFLERCSGQPVGIQAIHRKMARDEAVPYGPGGMKMDVSKLLTEQWGVMTVHDSAYHAAMPAVFSHGGKTLVNLFNPATLPVADEAADSRAFRGIQLFTDHMARTCTEPGVMRAIFQWLAWQVQRTGQKVRWCPLLIGFEGSGKSIIANLLRAVLGTANVKTIDSTGINNKGGFTDWGEGAAVTVIEEIYINGPERFEAVNRVKPFISNDVVYINRKGRTGLEILNGSNQIALSNFDDAVPLKDDDRRWLVSKTPFATIQQLWDSVGAKNDLEYFGEIFDSLNKYPGTWRRWLLDMEIGEDFDTRRAPMTAAKSRMADTGRDETEVFARALLEDGVDGCGYATWAFSTHHLQSAMQMRGIRLQTNSAHHLYSRMGFTCIGKCKSGHTYTRVWVLPPYANLRPGEVLARIVK